MPKLPSNITASENEVSQTFELDKEFGVDLSDEPRLKQEIGQMMLDRIRDRCEDENKDIFGEKFQAYSKEYIDSDTFKDFNKSASDRDMTLTGRMLEDIDFQDNGNSLTLLVTKETGKAYNHLIGDTLPQRAWFGIADKDLDSIKAEFSSEIERVKAAKAPKARSVLDLLTQEAVAGQTAETTFAQLFSASNIDFDLGDL